MSAWLRQYQGKLRFGLRMTLAGLASYALGHALGLAQTYWAVITAVFVMQGSVGGSLRAGINRLIGTAGGAVWGAAVSVLVAHHNVMELGAALFAAVAPLAILTGFRPDYRIAPITAIIVLMGSTSLQADPVSSALSRVLEISLGSAVAIVIALVILPARAHRLLARAASLAVSNMADLVAMLAKAPASGAKEEALYKVQSTIRAAIAQTETRAEEANVERANRLSDGPDPEPLARTLRRLRHDLAMLVRVLGAPFSQPVREHIEAPLAVLLKAIGSWLGAVSNALADGKTAPPLEAVHAAERDYKAAVAAGGQEVLAPWAGAHDTQRVFALLFLIEQMLQNLQDLADRTAGLAAVSEERDGVGAPLQR